MTDILERRGLAIAGPAGPVRLKWHKLRRRASDPPFDRANLAIALEQGASAEVDLRRLADNAFVCLHDDMLEGETTGTGPVLAVDGRTVAALRMRHPVTDAPGAAPLLLDELAATVARPRVHPDTVVQLDMKDDAPPPDAALERFAAALDGTARRFLASGMSWPAVRALGRAVPGLRLGFDPLRMAEEARPDSAAAFARFAAAVTAVAPEAETVYLSHRLVAAAAAAGAPLVGILRGEGRSVDCWTLDPDHDSIRALLVTAVESGVDQITTNAPLALARLWRGIAAEADGHRGAPATTGGGGT